MTNEKQVRDLKKDDKLVDEFGKIVVVIGFGDTGNSYWEIVTDCGIYLEFPDVKVEVLNVV